MAKRPTKFERDLADLHGDADIEMIDVTPGPWDRQRYEMKRSPERDLSSHWLAKANPVLRNGLFGMAFAAIGLGLLGCIALVVGSLAIFALIMSALFRS